MNFLAVLNISLVVGILIMGVVTGAPMLYMLGWVNALLAWLCVSLLEARV